jgi:hypothetical protein
MKGDKDSLMLELQNICDDVKGKYPKQLKPIGCVLGEKYYTKHSQCWVYTYDHFQAMQT